MKVFVQVDDHRCEGVAVNRGSIGFDVRELREGTSNTRFAYRVVAKRKGFEDKRLDYCEAAKNDPFFNPDLKEKELRELEQERILRAEERSQMEIDLDRHRISRAKSEEKHIKQRESHELLSETGFTEFPD